MMGPSREAQPALFYEFSLEDHVPQDHLLRSIDRFVDLSSIRAFLQPHGPPLRRSRTADPHPYPPVGFDGLVRCAAQPVRTKKSSTENVERVVHHTDQLDDRVVAADYVFGVGIVYLVDCRLQAFGTAVERVHDLGGELQVSETL